MATTVTVLSQPTQVYFLVRKKDENAFHNLRPEAKFVRNILTGDEQLTINQFLVKRVLQCEGTLDDKHVHIRSIEWYLYVGRNLDTIYPQQMEHPDFLYIPNPSKHNPIKWTSIWDYAKTDLCISRTMREILEEASRKQRAPVFLVNLEKGYKSMLQNYQNSPVLQILRQIQAGDAQVEKHDVLSKDMPYIITQNEEPIPTQQDHNIVVAHKKFVIALKKLLNASNTELDAHKTGQTSRGVGPLSVIATPRLYAFSDHLSRHNMNPCVGMFENEEDGVLGTVFFVSNNYIITALHNLKVKYSEVDHLTQTTYRSDRKIIVRDTNFKCKFPLVEFTVDLNDLVYPVEKETTNRIDNVKVVKFEVDVAVFNVKDKSKTILEINQNKEYTWLYDCFRLRKDVNFSSPSLADPLKQRVHIMGYNNKRELMFPDGVILGFKNWEVLYSTPTEKHYSGGPGFGDDRTLYSIHRLGGPAHSLDASLAQKINWFNVGTRADLFVQDFLIPKCKDAWEDIINWYNFIDNRMDDQ